PPQPEVGHRPGPIRRRHQPGDLLPRRARGVRADDRAPGEVDHGQPARGRRRPRAGLAEALEPSRPVGPPRRAGPPPPPAAPPPPKGPRRAAGPPPDPSPAGTT